MVILKSRCSGMDILPGQRLLASVSVNEISNWINGKCYSDIVDI